jgi:hypothetical protein
MVSRASASEQAELVLGLESYLRTPNGVGEPDRIERFRAAAATIASRATFFAYLYLVASDFILQNRTVIA